MAFPTPHDGSGTVLRFGALQFTVTNVVVANTNPAGVQATIDIANLGQTTGELSRTMPTPLIGVGDGGSGRQVTFDYLGKTVLLDGSTGTVLITIGGTALVGTTGAGATAFLATVASSTLTLATNDAVRGQGVLTLARTTSIT